MKLASHIDSTLVFRPRVAPDPVAMAMLKKKIESFSYIPSEGFHRDKVQPRLTPIAPYTPPPWLFGESSAGETLHPVYG